MKISWPDMSPLRKALTVISVCIFAVVIILAILQLTGAFNLAGFVFIPLLGLECLCQAYLQWKTSRGVAVVCIVVAVVILALFALGIGLVLR